MPLSAARRPPALVSALRPLEQEPIATPRSAIATHEIQPPQLNAEVARRNCIEVEHRSILPRHEQVTHAGAHLPIWVNVRGLRPEIMRNTGFFEVPASDRSVDAWNCSPYSVVGSPSEGAYANP